MKIIKIIKIIAGTIWAFTGLFLIIMLFLNFNGFSVSAAKLPFMKINPRYTGGEVARQVITESCTLNIRKPVFDGLFRERNTGFVQIDWRGTIPETICDTIDYDQDGIPDFKILLDSKDTKTRIEAFNKNVENLNISTPTSYGWSARINIRK